MNTVYFKCLISVSYRTRGHFWAEECIHVDKCFYFLSNLYRPPTLLFFKSSVAISIVKILLFFFVQSLIWGCCHNIGFQIQLLNNLMKRCVFLFNLSITLKFWYFVIFPYAGCFRWLTFCQKTGTRCEWCFLVISPIQLIIVQLWIISVNLVL